jgi:DNA-binding CsgD family transcriptional regulator
LTVGVIIVGHDACVLHANQVARHMLDAGWPLASLGGRLAALQAEVTKELRKAIAVVHDDSERIGAVGIGVPLMHAGRTAAAAHVLPLAQRYLQARSKPQAIAAVFVAPAGTHLPLEVGTVARIFGLTPAETRLLQQLVAGASLGEAAAALGVSEATTRTHRNHIFMKAGVSRRTDLLALIGHLIPPIYCTPSYPLGESTEPTNAPPSRTKRASTERWMCVQGKADSLPKMGA